MRCITTIRKLLQYKVRLPIKGQDPIKKQPPPLTQNSLNKQKQHHTSTDANKQHHFNHYQPNHSQNPQNNQYSYEQRKINWKYLLLPIPLFWIPVFIYFIYNNPKQQYSKEELQQKSKKIREQVQKFLLQIQLKQTGRLKPSTQKVQPQKVESEKVESKKVQDQKAQGYKVQAQKIESQQIKQKSMEQEKVENKNTQKKQNQRNKELNGSQQVEIKLFKKIQQIPQYDLQNNYQSENIIIVSQVPYNTQFEQELLSKIYKTNYQLTINNKQPLKIFRMNLSLEKYQKYIKENNIEIKQHTLFLIKNKYDNKLFSLSYQNYYLNDKFIQNYLKSIFFFENQINKILQIKSNQSYLIYLVDKDNQTPQKYQQRLKTAKYIQMQLYLNNFSGIKLLVIDKKQAINNHLINEENAKANTLHLLRKKNQFTFGNPNLWINKKQREIIPFYIINDIALYQSNNNLAIPNYLSKIEIFDAPNSFRPYVCNLTVDRNKISSQQFHRLLKTFNEIKQSNQYPMVSFILKLSKIPYMGSQHEQNNAWMIKLINIQKLELEMLLHSNNQQQYNKTKQIKTQQIQKLSYQHLYPLHYTNYLQINNFIRQGVQGKLPYHYKSQKPNILQNVHQLTAKNFQQYVLNDQNHHLVFQYSDHCGTCKTISPIISYLDQIYKSLSNQYLGKKLLIHKLNCDRNRVKSQLYSPYTPNIYFYKGQWKNSLIPVKFPLEFLSARGIIGLNNFCLITSQIGTIPWSFIENAISAQRKAMQLQVKQ